MDKPRVLIISSVTYGSGVLGVDIYDAFKREGYNVDFLTKDPLAGHNEFLTVDSRKEYRYSPTHIAKALKWRINKLLHPKGEKQALPGYCFFYKKEGNPPIPVKKVMSLVKRHYDFVYVVFWQELLSYRTIRAIDKKLGGVPWLLATVDYSTMTGGCHFPINCDRWQKECGCCPAWESWNPKDFTHHNILYRKKVIREMDISLNTNSFQKDNFFSKSTLYKDARFLINYPLVNENEFRPLPVDKIRKELSLPIDKKIILFGSQDLQSEYKGMKYLFASFNVIYSQMSEDERKAIVVVSVGRSNEKVHQSIPFKYIDFGYVGIQQLAKLYAAADIFACPSVFDPGPMMVNQALSCGTPVVAFNQGAIQDVNRFAECGYTARLRDVEDFSHGLYTILKMEKDNYERLRAICRETALKMTSRHAIVERIMTFYNRELKNRVQE